MGLINTYKQEDVLRKEVYLKKYEYLFQYDHPLEKINLRLLKRIVDLILSSLVIIFILSWLVPVLFILSKFFSEGSLFYVQKRVGHNNKPFNCYKFRSIKNKNNESEIFQPIMVNDSRLTRLGKLLRTLNLDELPQFINVLKGEMSIIGPRPHALYYENIYSKSIVKQNLRYKVKPGITGWAQIHGLRGDVLNENDNKFRIKKRIQYDLWYIQNWSITLDFKILFYTMMLVLREGINLTPFFPFPPKVTSFDLHN